MPIFKLNDKYVTKSDKTRLYGISNPIIGLTGGIATGKSKTSSILKAKGLHIIDADQLVKDIYKKEETINFVNNISKTFVNGNTIDFKTLREAFFTNTKIKEEIECFIYSKLETQFLENLPNNPNEVILYDVPLLFEKHLDSKVDQSLLIYCTPEQQISRFLTRDSIEPKLAQKIIQSQLSIEEKRLKSNYIIENTKDIQHLESMVDSYLTDYII